MLRRSTKDIRAENFMLVFTGQMIMTWVESDEFMNILYLFFVKLTSSSSRPSSVLFTRLTRGKDSCVKSAADGLERGRGP